jgi:hypothetical protein
VRFLVFAAALSAVAARKPLASERAYALVEDLFSQNEKVRDAARDSLVAARDASVAPALVEVLFFGGEGKHDAALALEKILGETHEPRFRDWLDALSRRPEIVPKPGYVAFKARQYARIDPELAAFFREEAPRAVRPEEIVSGGVKKDAIPALRNPRRVPAASATWLLDDESVFGVERNEKTRAYPLRVLDWHELANDVIGGTTVTLSYCTLCGSGILYETTLKEGETYTFGNSGLLYRSNKLMYDHQTGTLWSNLTGEPVLGPLAKSGKRLPALPLVVTTWREWRTRHPDTDVLSLETGYRRDYTPGAAYGWYERSAGPIFPIGRPVPNELAPKEWVFTLEVDGKSKAYPIEELRARPLLLDDVGGTRVALLTERSSGAVRAYRAGEASLRLEADALVDGRSGQTLTVTESALRSADGSVALARLPGHRSYWFAFAAFSPGAPLWRAK